MRNQSYAFSSLDYHLMRVRRSSFMVDRRQAFITFAMKMWEAKDQGYDVGRGGGRGLPILGILKVYPELGSNAKWLGVGAGGFIGFLLVALLVAKAFQ